METTNKTNHVELNFKSEDKRTYSKNRQSKLRSKQQKDVERVKQRLQQQRDEKKEGE